MKDKLTKTTVEAVRPADQDVHVWDTGLPGFGLKVTPKGLRVYVLQYRYRGRQTRCTIGRHEIDMKADEARRKARRLLGLLADGQDPKTGLKEEEPSPTVKELAERYMTDHALPHKKPSSAATDRRNLDNHVIPLLGKQFVSDVVPADIARLLRDVAAGKTAKDEKTGKKQGRRIVEGGKGVANRVLALLSKMFALAERWDLRPQASNPCSGTAKFAEHKVERFLSTQELARLGTALAAADRAVIAATDGKGAGRRQRSQLPDQAAVTARTTEQRSALTGIRLLLFTGCRLGEILNLKWAQVDFERRLLLLPDSKTGAKAVYLSSHATQLLQNTRRVGENPYVLAGREAREPIASLRGAWGRLCKAAKISDVRLHDLRHSFASVGAAGGLSLPVIGGLLGHSQPSTTARYAHLAASPLHEAVNAIGSRIAAAMNSASTPGEAPSGESSAVG